LKKGVLKNLEMNFLRNIQRVKILYTAVLFAFILIGVNTHSQESPEIDPVIEYYLEGIDSSFAHRYLFNTDYKFEFSVKSILTRTNYRGVVQSIDTAAYRLYFNGGTIDSFNVLDSADDEQNTFPDSFSFFKPWKQSGEFYFFPNDTGAGNLAIGFEPEEYKSEMNPTGMIIFDRDTFLMQNVLLHFINPSEFDRLSQSFTFEYVFPYLILREYKKQGVESGFFAKRYSSQIFEFYDYIIQ